jgi:hypothetical protein
MYLGGKPHRRVVRDQDIGPPVLTVRVGDGTILDIDREIWIPPVSGQDIRDDSSNFSTVNRTEFGMRDTEAYRQSSGEPWQDGSGFSLLGRGRRHLQVPVPKKRRREILKQFPDMGRWNSYVHEVRHDLCIIDLITLRIVTPSLNWYGPHGLNQPAGKCPLAELGSLCGEMKEAAILRGHGRQCREPEIWRLQVPRTFGGTVTTRTL